MRVLPAMLHVPGGLFPRRVVIPPPAPVRPVEAGEEFDPILWRGPLAEVPGFPNVLASGRAEFLPDIFGEALVGGHGEGSGARRKKLRHAERVVGVSRGGNLPGQQVPASQVQFSAENSSRAGPRSGRLRASLIDLSIAIRTGSVAALEIGPRSLELSLSNAAERERI